MRTAILPAYDLGVVRECRLQQHNQNDTYLVCADRGRFMLKVYEARGGYTPRGSHLAHELDLLRYLHQQGVSVAAPVVRRDGRYLGSLAAPEGSRTAVLFSEAVGKPVPATAWDEAFGQNLGATVGAMHAAAAGFRSQLPRFRLDRGYLLARPVRLARPFFAHRADDWAYVRGLARRLTDQVEALTRAGLSQGVCHGDIGGKTNVHVDPNGMMTLFDFECCGPGWRAYDIGVFRWALAQLTPPQQEQRVLAAFLAGYERHCPLTTADRQAVPVFVAVRQFWFMGLRTGNAHHWGQAEVDDPALDELLAFWRGWESHLGAR